MEKIHLPAHQGGGHLEVTHLSPPKETGTAWARGLSAAQRIDLVDLAGALSVYFPPLKQRRVTERQFFSKLKKLGVLEQLNQQLVRITGSSAGITNLYNIWWSYTWVWNYSRACEMKDRTEEEARDETAERMNLTPEKAQARLTRRDVSFIVNLFLSRRAQEMRGAIEHRTALDALNGGTRDRETYFRNIAVERESHVSDAHEINAEAMAEDELRREIAALRKSVGEVVDTIPAEVEITDAEFEQD